MINCSLVILTSLQHNRKSWLAKKSKHPSLMVKQPNYLKDKEKKKKPQHAISQGRGRGIKEGLIAKPLRVSPASSKGETDLSSVTQVFSPVLLLLTKVLLCCGQSILCSESCEGKQACSERPTTLFAFSCPSLQQVGYFYTC